MNIYFKCVYFCILLYIKIGYIPLKNILHGMHSLYQKDKGGGRIEYGRWRWGGQGNVMGGKWGQL